MDERLDLNEGSGSERVSGQVSLLRTSKSIWVSASLDANVANQCGRCLMPFGESVHMDVEEEFFPILDPTTGARMAPEDIDADTLFIDQQQMLDLKPTIREYASMALSMKPLCEPDCAGLCSSCGVNLNHRECACENSSRDPRWGVLLDLARNGPSQS